MRKYSWQLIKPLQAIVFDCDGTLSKIEGINELAAIKGVGPKVAELTSMAMTRTGINAEIYAERLALVKPTLAEIQQIAQKYCSHLVPDAAAVINVFKQLNKEIFIASAGLKLAVNELAALLEIPTQHVFAVDIQLNQQNYYVDFDHDSPLVDSSGKLVIVEQLKQKYPEIAFIGDSIDDYRVNPFVSRFVGFGGAFFREQLLQNCDYYISTLSMAPLLPLLLTQTEVEKLDSTGLALYQLGIDYYKKDMVKIS